MTEAQVEDNKKLHEELVSTYEFNMDNPPPVKHNFVKRGAVLSCEGAGHPNHRHFLKKEAE